MKQILIASTGFCLSLAIGAATAEAAGPGVVQAQELTPNAPSEMYGLCAGWPHGGAGTRTKLTIVMEPALPAGKKIEAIKAIAIVKCQGYTGMGPGQIVACPSGTAYSYCVHNNNDGMGNDVTLGVTEDSQDITCALSAQRSGPLAQIDVTIRPAPNEHIGSIDMQGATNAIVQAYPTVGDAGPVTLTFTKVNQSRPASTGPVSYARHNSGPKSCSFDF